MDDESVLSKESLSILKGHSDLNDDFLTLFCLLVGESVAEVNLPKNHKQAMLSADADFAEFEKFKIYHGIACKLPS